MSKIRPHYKRSLKECRYPRYLAIQHSLSKEHLSSDTWQQPFAVSIQINHTEIKPRLPLRDLHPTITLTLILTLTSLRPQRLHRRHVRPHQHPRPRIPIHILDKPIRTTFQPSQSQRHGSSLVQRSRSGRKHIPPSQRSWFSDPFRHPRCSSRCTRCVPHALEIRQDMVGIQQETRHVESGCMLSVRRCAGSLL